MIDFIDLPSLYDEMAYEAEQDLIDCLRKCSFSGGYYLERFERNFSSYLGLNYTIGVSSGTDATMIALEALGIGKGDFVLVPNNANVGIAHGIARTEANIIFVDCDPYTFQMDAEQVEKILTTHVKKKKIKAMIVVDMYGQQPDMEIFQEISQKYNVAFIENASQSVGSTYRGRHIGSYSDLATISFGPKKSLWGIGQGGAIVTNDVILSKKIRTIINQGFENKNQCTMLGGNYQLDALMAAQLYHVLKRIDYWIGKKRDIAKIYHEHFTHEQQPTQQPCVKHTYHLYQFQCKNSAERDRLERELSHNQIGYGINYPILISDTAPYAKLGILETPVAHDIRDRLISLPIHPNLTEEQALEVVLTVQSVTS